MTDNLRKTRVVNPHYQYRAAFTITLVAIILINFFILAAALAPELMTRLARQSHAPYYIIGILEVLVIYICFRKTLGATHRVAGPVYALDRELMKLRDGDLTFSIQLRPKDEFHQVAESINASVGQLRERIDEIKRLAEQLDGEHSSETVDRLRRALDDLKTDGTGGE